MMEEGKVPVRATLDELTETNPAYEAFVEKFKPKRTTDDCETPANVYEAVCSWVEKRYGVDRSSFVRPFWPGEDYTKREYPEGCIVCDNPPFSIVTKIVRFYHAHGIRYFLFGPHLTSLQSGKGAPCCHVFAPCDVTYANGARVNTAFLTNLDTENVVETAPDLLAALLKAEKENTGRDKKALPRYEYPPEVLTSAICGKIAEAGISMKIPRGDAVPVSTLDEQREAGKQIFGGGLILSTRAARIAAEKRAEADRAVETRAARRMEEQAAETLALPPRIRWSLSDRERAIQRALDEGAEGVCPSSVLQVQASASPEGCRGVGSPCDPMLYGPGREVPPDPRVTAGATCAGACAGETEARP